MKIESRLVDEKRGIVQITTADERFYSIPNKDGGVDYYPSVTWIVNSGYPKDKTFMKWLASTGWDESQAIKEAAGGKGGTVHNALNTLIRDKSFKIDQRVIDPRTGLDRDLTPEEYECLMSYAKWHEIFKPEVLATDLVVINSKFGYAGTIDVIFRINGKVWIIDFKTSQSVWPEYKMQLNAYRNCDWIAQYGTEIGLAVLQIGYKLNKARYKFTEVEDNFPLFLSVRQIWQSNYGDETPFQMDYPMVLTL